MRKIHDLRSTIASLRTTKLNELMRLNANRVDDLFEGFGENGELARFLILEGHLDDTYYQYTSLFHSGRLSPNDNKFLIQIRAYITPEPDFPIDNPIEVIAAMREEDFQQSYVMNVKLVDSLLSGQSPYPSQRQKFFAFLSSEFESCEGFLDSYYASGSHVAELLVGLVAAWNGFLPTFIASPKAISHVSQLVTNLSEGQLKTLANNFGELSEFVSTNLSNILAHSPEIEPERLECLAFEVADLAAIQEHPRIVRFMFEKGLFEITIANFEFAFQEILGEFDLQPLREKNFTAIRSTSNSTLLKRIERDFESYLHNVLLELPKNSREEVAAILDVVQRDTLDRDDIRVFLERQITLLPSLDHIPDGLHAMLFQLGAIEPSWTNCLAFIESDGFESGSLTKYLDREDVRAAILKRAISGVSGSQKLRQFLFNAGPLSNIAYQEYAQALPKPFSNFPKGFDPSKLRILIDERKVTFSKESLNALADATDLQVLFVATNINTYLAGPDDFALDDNFREELLRAEIDGGDKVAIVQLMELSSLVGLPERSALIGPIINRPDANISKIDASIAQSLILHAAPIETRISLFNKLHSLMADEEVRQVLANLPQPFSEIKTGYGRPRLKNSPENLKLVEWLDTRSIISSWREGSLFSDDISVNLYR